MVGTNKAVASAMDRWQVTRMIAYLLRYRSLFIEARGLLSVNYFDQTEEDLALVWQAALALPSAAHHSGQFQLKLTQEINRLLAQQTPDLSDGSQLKRGVSCFFDWYKELRTGLIEGKEGRRMLGQFLAERVGIVLGPPAVQKSEPSAPNRSKDQRRLVSKPTVRRLPIRRRPPEIDWICSSNTFGPYGRL